MTSIFSGLIMGRGHKPPSASEREMVKQASRFFTTKPGSKGGMYYKAGTMLFLRGKQIGTVAQDKHSKKFVAFLVNGKVEEFDTFAQADEFAWKRGLGS